MNYEALNDLVMIRTKARVAAEHEERGAHLVQLLRFLNEVLSDIYERSDPTSKTPLNDLGMIRTKARVATEQAAKSGLLS